MGIHKAGILSISCPEVFRKPGIQSTCAVVARFQFRIWLQNCWGEWSGIIIIVPTCRAVAAQHFNTTDPWWGSVFSQRQKKKKERLFSASPWSTWWKEQSLFSTCSSVPPPGAAVKPKGEKKSFTVQVWPQYSSTAFDKLYLKDSNGTLGFKTSGLFLQRSSGSFCYFQPRRPQG